MFFRITFHPPRCGIERFFRIDVSNIKKPFLGIPNDAIGLLKIVSYLTNLALLVDTVNTSRVIISEGLCPVGPAAVQRVSEINGSILVNPTVVGPAESSVSEVFVITRCSLLEVYLPEFVLIIRASDQTFSLA